jgi:F-type H+-transporting ATPase subunit gamma
VNSTQQITKAMKMVSASKLRRAQDAILQLRPFAQKLKEILENVAESVDPTGSGAFAKVRPVNKVLIVAVTSNRGLAGGFNANVIRTVNRLLADTYAEQVRNGNLKVLAIGKKASDFFNKNKAVYQVVVVYNQFKNAAVQYVITEQLLPIAPPAKKDKTKVINDYIFEPSQEEIVLELIPKSIKIQLYKAILDSHASEHGARMTAMSKATDNAGELIKELKLQYNKARQASITNEILEIVAGAEALNG